MRHSNGVVNVGIAAISTRQRLPGSAGVGAESRGHRSTIAVRGAASHAGGSVGPNRRGVSASA